MSQLPPTRYATSDGIHIAYQVVGDGQHDLVVIPGAASHLDALWEEPSVARWYRHLASFSRLIMFDKRGTGMSDRVEGVPSLEARMDDVRVVMDAVGVERAALCGVSEGGAIGALFAATYPQRTSALVIIGSGASGWRPDPETQKVIEAYIEEHWGSGASLDMMAPSMADDQRVRSWFGRWERLAASPGAAVALLRMNAAFDITEALPTVSAPTLVIHRTGDQTFPVTEGRALADRILGARFVELPGTDHAPWFEDAETMLGLIEEFVTGERHVIETDRVLATTLFTDIVDSTAAAARLGDRRWRELLDAYDDLAAREVARFGGRVIKATGDGTLATFDGPARAVSCAKAIGDGASHLGLGIRSGLHTGEIELRGDDVSGLAVVIAQRVSSLAGAAQILVSSTVKDLVIGSGIAFDEHGEHELKGVPGSWRTFAVKP